jgi:hypothetical protein
MATIARAFLARPQVCSEFPRVAVASMPAAVLAEGRLA